MPFNTLRERRSPGSPSWLSAWASPHRLFWAFAVAHAAIWTLLPALARRVTPMDSTEAAAWGRHLVLGYPRDPWLVAWIARLITELGGSHDWPFYLASQVCVAAGFWAVWRLGREILSEWHALVAVLMLAGVQFVSVAAVDFNDNVLLLALWPLSALALHSALRSGRLSVWALLGLLGGLALMAKYSSVVLLAAMVVYLLADARTRARLSGPGPWLAVAVLAAVVTPHMVWLARHDWLTVHYSTGRLQSHAAGWPVRHMVWPLRFAGTVIATFLGAVVLFAFVALARRGRVLAPAHPPKAHDRRFLWIVGLGPFVAVLALAMIRGWWLRSLWGMPLVSLWGLGLLASTPVEIRSKALERMVGAVIVVMIAIAGVKTISYAWPGRESSSNYPMREIAREITERWHQRFGRPLRTVAGRRLEASYVSRYSADHPDLLVDFDLQQSPWLTAADLERGGAVLVRRLAAHAPVQSSFESALAPSRQGLAAGLEVPFIVEHAYARARPGQAPMRILAAFLPPAATH